jgi:hypothetical protein
LVASLLLAGGIGALTAVAPALAASGSVKLAASIDGRAVAGADSVKLKPTATGKLGVTVTNDTDRPVSIRTVRLEGRVVGLVFYAYDTSVVLDVAPHSSQTRTITMDTGDLGSQADGLIPSEVIVLDAHRNEVASQDVIVDVRGSLWSIYGLFGLVILLVTSAWTVDVVLRLSRGTLPANRWLRAMRFLIPGIGFGLVFVFTLSTLRILAPTASLWIPVVLGCAVLTFVLGYFSPDPAGGPVPIEDADAVEEDPDGAVDETEPPADEEVVPAGTLLPGDGW